MTDSDLSSQDASTESDQEALEAFDALLAAAPTESPWDGAIYRPNYELLEKLLAIPIAREDVQESGKPAKAFDFWLAHEFRRAGFDGVWPRAQDPRVMPETLVSMEEALLRLEERVISMETKNDDVIRPSIRNSLFALRKRLRKGTEPVVLGRFYPKQIDVLISGWKTGPELLASTKTMFSSYRKNRPNRFEEAVGDAANLRIRHPLAAIGYAFMVRSNINDESGAKTLIEDMVSNLKGEEGGYDATTLIVADWIDGGSTVKVLIDQVPEDLRPDRFMKELIEAILERTPVSYHVTARELREGKKIEIEEGDEESEESAD